MAMITKTRLILFYCLFFSLVLLCSHVYGRSILSDEPPTPEIDVSVSLPPVVYSELPCITQIIVKNNVTKVAILSTEQMLAMQDDERGKYYRQQLLSNLRIPEFGILSHQPPPFSVEIFDRKGNIVIPSSRPGIFSFFTTNAEMFNPGDGGPIDQMQFLRPHMNVASGQQGLLIVDLQPWMQTLRSGEYKLTLTIYPGGILAAGRGGTLNWKSEPVKFKIKRLEGSTSRAIRRAFPAVTADRPDESDLYKSFEPWVQQYAWMGGYAEPRRFGWLKPAGDLQELREQLPDEVWANLAVYNFLGASIKMEPDAELPIELLDLLPEQASGIGTVLRYELLLEKGDEAAALALRNKILKENPGLLWQLDSAKKGEGIIQQVKKHITKSKPESNKDGADSP